MKTHLITAALILGLTCPAFAEVKSFSRVTVDVPSGWSSMEQEGTIMVVDPSGENALVIHADDIDGVEIEEIAKHFAKEMDGGPVKKSDNGYVFTNTDEDGEESMTHITQRGDEYFSITLVGKESPEMNAVIETVKSKAKK